jgi:putative PIN family toxin of toxin-antitoxin system
LRIVLDTNVIVSGLLNPEGTPGRVLDLFLAGEITMVVDDRILAEYRAVLPRPKFGFEPADVSDVLDLVEAEAERVAAPPLRLALMDEADRPFMEVAVASGADFLVTGNVRRFRALSRRRSLVATPAEFLREWNRARER